jgi:hypothetical protein
MHQGGRRRANHFPPPPRTGRVAIATHSAGVLGATSRSNTAADASDDEEEDAAALAVS